MDTLIHADVFFFVTTIAVVVVGAALTVALIYLAKVLSDIKKITAEVREEAVLFRKDIAEVRAEMKHQGSRLKSMIDLVTGMIRKRKITKTSRSK